MQGDFGKIFRKLSHAGIFTEKLRASLLAKQFFGKYSHRAKPVSEMPRSGFELRMAPPPRGRLSDSAAFGIEPHRRYI